MPSLLRFDPGQPLLFTSGQFLFWFSLFYAFYLLLERRQVLRVGYLLLFSWFFYYKSSGVFVAALWGTTALDFVVAQKLAASESTPARRAWLLLSIVSSGGLLFGFKYIDWLAGGVADLVGVRFQPLDVFLPAGISFYTFQSISYVVDVYRRRLEPSRSLLEYALYLSFFPQIVAGPIVRASELFAELRRPPRHDRDRVGSGLFRVLLGVIKKAVVADTLGVFVDRVFDGGAGLSSFELLLGVYAYSLQIYLDFSGYSDIAIGLGRLVGIELPENFRTPYAARSITDFWRRWHITLSSWLRDYIYVPLGGNRRGRARQALNLLLTMAFGGLWHGAGVTFVLWGLGHGLLLCVEKLTPGPVRTLFDRRLGRVLAWLLTFHAVAALFILFRAGDLGLALEIAARIVRDFDPATLVPVLVARSGLILTLGFAVAFALSPAPANLRLARWFAAAPLGLRLACLLVVVQTTLELRGVEVTPFIYFQF